MTGIRLNRTSHEHVVLTGAMWNQLCDVLERLDRFAVAPPLYFARNDAAGRVLAVNAPPGGGKITRVKVKGSITSGYFPAVKWDGTTETWAQFNVRAVQGHATNDTTYAVQVEGGTDVPGVTWIEYLALPVSTNRYQQVQVIDATGRIGIDSARFET